VERVALSQLVNDEIRVLAQRFHLPASSHRYTWLCACGWLAEYDASAGHVFAPAHPLGKDRVAAAAAFQQEPDPSAVVEA
jgi:hypothetical protein